MIENKLIHLEWTDFDGWPWKWNSSNTSLQDIGKSSIDLGFNAHYHGTTIVPCEDSDLVGRVDSAAKSVIIRRGLNSNRDVNIDNLVEKLYKIILKTYPEYDVYYFPYGDQARRVI